MDEAGWAGGERREVDGGVGVGGGDVLGEVRSGEDKPGGRDLEAVF